MFTKLSSKLTFAMVLVSALTILFAIFFIDGAMDRQFAVFVENTQQEHNQQVVEAVRELYQQRGDLRNLEEQLTLLGVAGDVEIVISPHGSQHDPIMGRAMGQGPMHMRRKTTRLLTLPDGTEATIEVTPTFNIDRTSLEDSFRRAVNRSIVLAAILSVIGAILISSFFSWGLTKPLKQLIGTVRSVGQGNLKERTEVKGNDELSFLRREFNQMAANLEKQESARIKFTNNVAHEVRTPLSIIQSYLEAMGDGVVEANSANLALVLEETQRLGGLVGSLQELANLEKPMSNKKKVDLGRTISLLLQSLSILAEEKQITLDWKSPDQIFTFGDEEQLATALRNVILNAIKYTPIGGFVSVSLKAENTEAKIEISDTGIGINVQELPFIFERFYRTDSSRSRETGGTGIGLAITAEIIKNHEGTIEVHSEPGLGSTFTIRLSCS